MMPLAADFVRHANRNATTDVICTRCFKTIATISHEAELLEAEKRHECEHLYMPLFDVDESQRGTF